jgi:acetylornithine aminotransferase/acetylornithine/N-succinyldiaminopimelate aminotransferase
MDDVIAIDKKYYMNTYGDRNPVCFEYGKGVNLWDINGKMYYDFFSGIAVNSLGHNHPNIVTTLKNQIDKLIHTSNLYYTKPQAVLAQKIVENSCADKVFFSNSGAEANEGAIKLAKIYFYKKGFKDKYEIITLKNSFHGRTLTTVAATGQEKYQKPYAPLTPGFKHSSINDIEEIEKLITPNTCAIMLEPIQGESGVHPVNYEYISKVRGLCNKNNVLLIFDEIQTGMGRTGKLFGYEHFGIEPDIFTLAKALGGGVPIGALCAKDHVASAFEPGDHGTTFGGNPLACSAGITVIDTLLNEGVIENCHTMGNYFMGKLNELKEKHTIISDIRGKGLMLGMELNEDISKNVMNKLLDKGFLVGSVGTRIIRFLPPLIIEENHIDKLIFEMDKILEGV